MEEKGAWRDRSYDRGCAVWGRGYIVEAFARQEYESYIIIDFNNTTKQIKELFVNTLDDLDTLFMYLGHYAGVKLKEMSSLIVFDEVQCFPPARAAIKYLVKDGRYDYIETGSLVSIRKNVKGITIPSEEEPIQMNPMDFEEFLWAMGEDTLMDLIRVAATHGASYAPQGNGVAPPIPHCGRDAAGSGEI